MQILKDLVHGRTKVCGLQSGHHDVKGHVFNDVEIRRMNSSVTGEMELYEIDGIWGKGEQLQILFIS